MSEGNSKFLTLAALWHGVARYPDAGAQRDAMSSELNHRLVHLRRSLRDALHVSVCIRRFYISHKEHREKRCSAANGAKGMTELHPPVIWIYRLIQ